MRKYVMLLAFIGCIVALVVIGAQDKKKPSFETENWELFCLENSKKKEFSKTIFIKPKHAGKSFMISQSADKKHYSGTLAAWFPENGITSNDKKICVLLLNFVTGDGISKELNAALSENAVVIDDNNFYYPLNKIFLKDKQKAARYFSRLAQLAEEAITELSDSSIGNPQVSGKTKKTIDILMDIPIQAAGLDF